MSNSIVFGQLTANEGYDIVLDDVGNLYVTGSFTGTLQMGSYSVMSNGGYDMFLAKLSNTGTVQWLEHAGSSGSDGADRLVLHPNGHLYVIGGYSDNAQFGSQTLSSMGLSDAFVAEYDLSGNVINVFTGGGTGLDRFDDIAIGPNGNLYLGGLLSGGSVGSVFDTIVVSTFTGTAENKPFVAKYTPQGNIIWINHLSTSFGGDGLLKGLAVDASGTVYAGGIFRTTLYGGGGVDTLVTQGSPNNLDFFFWKLNANGQSQWLRGGGGTSNDYCADVMINDQGMPIFYGRFAGNFIVDGVSYGSAGTPLQGGIMLFTYDTNGNLVKDWLLESDITSHQCQYNAEGNYLLTGVYWGDVIASGITILDHTISSDGFLMKLTPEDSIIFANPITGIASQQANGFASDLNGNIYLTGYGENPSTFGYAGTLGSLTINSMGDDNMFVTSVWDSSFTTYGDNLIRGQIFVDNNQNCFPDSPELPFMNQIVRVEPGPRWGVTDSNGQYEIALDSGTYELTMQLSPLQSSYVDILCPSSPASYPISFSGANDTISGLHFGASVDTCYMMQVNVGSTGREFCMRNSTVITYRNLGIIDVPNAQIYLSLPPQVVLIQADSSYQQLPDGTFVFPVGNVPPGFVGQISIIDSVICGDPADLVGASQCTEVWATPLNNCIDPDPAWSEADLSIEGICQNGIAVFHLINQGIGNMTDSTTYRVYQDSLLVMSQKVRLQAGDSLSFQILAAGSFVRVEADQVPFHPYTTQVSADLDGCDATPSLTGMSVLYDQHDREPERSVDCMIITGPYDPNDKLATPVGLGTQHIVPSQTPIHYRIRFQNTGNDTAINVILIDTLSSSFDPTSIVMEASSHPYQFTVSGIGEAVLQFTFEDILLPDSMTNPLGSQGFVSFSIRPYDSLAQGTMVQNEADIYFDFNPPIRTNTTFHTFLDTSMEELDPSFVQICDATLPPAFAGLDSSFCEWDSIALSAEAAILGIGQWELLNGSGMLEDVFSSESMLYDLPYGEIVLSWNVQLCEQISRDTLLLQRFEQAEQAVIVQVGTDSLGTNATALTYAWYLDGVLLPESSQSIMADQSGVYTLELINGPCISELSEEFLFMALSKHNPQQSSVQWYPNPSNGLFTVRLRSQHIGDHIWKVYDSKGNICAQKVVGSFVGTQQWMWNLSHLADGLYVVHMGEFGYQKILIQR